MSARTFITGFGAFGTVAVNPSAKLAEASKRPFQVLEVAFAAVDEYLTSLNPESFDRLLMLGVAASRERMCPELFGRNFIGKTPDVRGIDLEGEIEAGAPLLLESTLWTPEIASEIVAFDPHTKLSMDAGEYLCNYISYRALQRFPEKKVGFLHIPAEDKLPLDVQMASLTKILEVIERTS